MGDKRALAWKVMTVVAGVGAGKAAEQVMRAIWQKVTGTEAPLEPADRRQPLLQVLAFALGVGALAGVTRALANRTAAIAWEVALGDTPPVIED